MVPVQLPTVRGEVEEEEARRSEPPLPVPEGLERSMVELGLGPPEKPVREREEAIMVALPLEPLEEMVLMPPEIEMVLPLNKMTGGAEEELFELLMVEVIV